jgi:RHS repeat-associated protein
MGTGCTSSFYADSLGTQSETLLMTGEAGAPAAGQRLYYHYNRHGDAAVVTTQEGDYAINEYFAYGSRNEAHCHGVPSFRPGFDGQEKDASGLAYHSSRYYDSDLGRFTTLDTASQGATNSSSAHLNGYAYGAGNPVGARDPGGNALPAVAITALLISAVIVGIASALIFMLINFDHKTDGERARDFFAGFVLGFSVFAAPVFPQLALNLAFGLIFTGISTAGRPQEDHWGIMMTGLVEIGIGAIVDFSVQGTLRSIGQTLTAAIWRDSLVVELESRSLVGGLMGEETFATEVTDVPLGDAIAGEWESGQIRFLQGNGVNGIYRGVFKIGKVRGPRAAGIFYGATELLSTILSGQISTLLSEALEGRLDSHDFDFSAMFSLFGYILGRVLFKTPWRAAWDTHYGSMLAEDWRGAGFRAFGSNVNDTAAYATFPFRMSISEALGRRGAFRATVLFGMQRRLMWGKHASFDRFIRRLARSVILGTAWYFAKRGIKQRLEVEGLIPTF